MASTVPMFKSLAPRLSRLPSEFFTCRQCLRNGAMLGEHPRPWLGILRSTRANRLASTLRQPTSPPALKSTFLSSLSRRIGGQARTGGSSFPTVSGKPVAYWLLASAASVFGIVVFGGLTRLTESG